jgi:A/G-specific adenine glycosylase
VTLAGDLLDWYERHQRSLPWRDAPSPYHTWVSEIMLQQTRVETVRDRYARFLTVFPTVEALAAAPLDDVLREWAGLGYYARARNLHAAARVVAEQGAFPRTVAELETLPGVGRYTAGAIASISFGVDTPAIDGNAIRVLSRVHRYGGGRAGLERLCAEAIPRGRAGAFNQALMDLGSACCVPQEPACVACPIARHCKARATGEVHLFPAVTRKAPSPRVRQVALVWEKGHRLLFGRRPAEGLFGGLYELPTGDLLPGEDPAEAAPRIARELLSVTLRGGAASAPITHVLTHRRLEVFPVRVLPDRLYGRARPASDRYTALRWWKPTDAEQVSTLTKKLLRATA